MTSIAVEDARKPYSRNVSIAVGAMPSAMARNTPRWVVGGLRTDFHLVKLFEERKGRIRHPTDQSMI